MSDHSLKPCPFCGGEAMLDNSGSGNVDGRGNSLARVWCPDPDCKTHGTAYLEEWEAIKVWNRRVPAAAPELLEALRGLVHRVDDYANAGCEDITPEWTADAHAAIAKAGG